MNAALTRTLLFFTCLALGACMSTKQGKAPDSSGFLPDYSLLHPGSEGQAEKVYIKPDVDWARYNKVLLDPVTLWRGKDSRFKGVSATDAQKMADYFYQLIYTSLEKDFKMVKSPEPGTLRISVALVKLKEADVTMETISTVVPQARLLTSLSDAASGSPSFVGSASVEAKIVDAASGVLLAEGADTRVGGRALNSVDLDSWSDVENVMKFWVERSSYNLCKAQKRTDCIAPEH